MIAVNPQFPTLTPTKYLAWEETQTDKHEYINGNIYAMGGGSINHGRIAIRLTAIFDAHLEGRGCITGNSDIKVNIPYSNNYTYPDASVTCDERDKNQTQYFTYPCLIVEVLSASTEAYGYPSETLRERGGKFRLYSQNPNLVDYLLVSSTTMEMDLYHKDDSGKWIIVNYKEGDTVELKSINFKFPIEQVYRGLPFTTES